MPSKPWKHPLVRLAISLLILAALFAWLPVGELWQSIRGVSWVLWLSCWGALLVGHVAGSFKWSLLIGVGGSPPPFLSALRFHFAGLFANLFLPSIAGGDVVRAGLAIRSGSRSETVVLGSLVDRMIDTAVLVLLVVIGGYVSSASLSGGVGQLLAILVTLLGLGAAAGLLALIVPLPSRLPQRLRDGQARLRGAAAALVRRPSRAILAFLLALSMQTLFVGLNALLGSACGIDLPFSVWLFVWPLAKISAMAPISLGGLGVREAALAFLLAGFGVAGAASVGVGLLWESILIATGAFGGLFYATVRRDLVTMEARHAE